MLLSDHPGISGSESAVLSDAGAENALYPVYKIAFYRFFKTDEENPETQSVALGVFAKRAPTEDSGIASD